MRRAVQPGSLPLRLRARLRAATLCAESTIGKWWGDRAAVRPAIDARLTEAAHALGISHPDEYTP